MSVRGFLLAFLIVTFPVVTFRCAQDMNEANRGRCERQIDIAVALGQTGTEGYERMADLTPAQLAELREDVCS